jgi:hypothetical protein
MDLPSTGRCRPTHYLISLGAVWSIALACVAQQPPKEGVGLRGGIDSASAPDFQAYTRRLTFSKDIEFGDRQALLVGHYPDRAQYGPLATIVPEQHSYEGSLGDLRRGKVIAKIINESDRPYPKLGLMPHATTYWWVQYDSSTGKGRSVFVAVDTTTGRIVQRTERGLEINTYHDAYRVTGPLARFVWDNDDETSWGTCNGACCHSLK